MAETIQALTNRVVVEQEKPIERVGEIILAATAQDPIPRGVVLAVGPDGEAAGIKKGDYVLFSPYAGQKSKLEGEDGKPREVLVLFLNEIHGRIFKA